MKKYGRILAAFRAAVDKQNLKSDFPIKKPHFQRNTELNFASILHKVSRKTRTTVLHRDGETEFPSFRISCSHTTYVDMLHNDVFGDWPGLVEKYATDDTIGNEVLLSINDPDVCDYPKQPKRILHPLLRLKHALAEYSVPRILDIQLIDPGVYVPVRSMGDFRCVAFPGGKAFQWVLESKSKKIRHNEEFNEIKYTKSLSKRLFLDPRAAVRAPAIVCSDDARAWISLEFPPEGSEESAVNLPSARTMEDQYRHLQDSYFALWKHLADFFRVAYIQQALRVENPWMGDITCLDIKDKLTNSLDSEPLGFNCSLVHHPQSSETVLIIGPQMSGKRTIAHHLLSCCPTLQLATSTSAVFSLHHANGTAVYADGCPLFHSVGVGAAIGSLFPNPYLEKSLTPEFALKYLRGVSEDALWNISREIPVTISKLYGPDRVVAGLKPITAALILNWSPSQSALISEPAEPTLLRADPPKDIRWTALDACLLNHVALPTLRFVSEKNLTAIPNSRPLKESAVAQALVGERLKYLPVRDPENQGMTLSTNIRWYEVAGEVNFRKVTQYVIEKIFRSKYVAPPGT